jgi:hypothetical protein
MTTIQPSPELYLSPRSRRRKRLLWLATVTLVLLGVCGFFFTIALMSRGELTATVLGTELRLWRITGKHAGLGLGRTVMIRQVYYSCAYDYITLILWEPKFSIDSQAYDNCH